MLDLIDRLPRDTYYWQVITKDPEHAAMLVEAQERAEAAGEKGDNAPPMSAWSPVVEAITTLTDRVNSLIYITRAANGAKGEQPPKPITRPTTAITSIKSKRRQQRHESLTARLLGR